MWLSTTLFLKRSGKTKKNKAILFVNNGIHPGEPDGIDATMMLMRDLAVKK
jgi:hypothetical protein